MDRGQQEQRERAGSRTLVIDGAPLVLETGRVRGWASARVGGLGQGD